MNLYPLRERERKHQNWFVKWWKAHVRKIMWGSFYIRFTPNWGIGFPWFNGRRVRIAWHHGIQIVKWVTDRWYVEKQVFGRNRVLGGEDLILHRKTRKK